MLNSGQKASAGIVAAMIVILFSLWFVPRFVESGRLWDTFLMMITLVFAVFCVVYRMRPDKFGKS